MRSHNVPALRLEGFDGEWELKAIGDLFAERHESFPEGELLSVTLRNGIKRFQEIGRHNTSNEDKSKYKLVEVGDIAYNSMRMWQGASGVSPWKGIVSPAYTVLKPIGSQDTCFFAYYFKTSNMIHEFQLNSQGLTSDTWNLKYPALSDIEIYRPQDIEEQQAIGAIFTNLDAAINQHTKKHQALQQAQAALMQRMFPQEEGQTVPELRLDGFDGEWELKAIGDLSGRAYGGGTPSSDEPGYWSGDIPWIQSSDVAEQGVAPVAPRKHITREAISRSAAMQIPADSVAVVTRVGVGKVSFMPFPYATSQDFVSLSDLSGNPEYIALTVKRRMEGLADQLQGSTIKGITKTELLNQAVYFPPTLEEQQAIGAVFTRLDTLISTEAKCIESLKQTKTALLQQMFI